MREEMGGEDQEEDGSKRKRCRVKRSSRRSRSKRRNRRRSWR